MPTAVLQSAYSGDTVRDGEVGVVPDNSLGDMLLAGVGVEQFVSPPNHHHRWPVIQFPLPVLKPDNQPPAAFRVSVFGHFEPGSALAPTTTSEGGDLL
jgi:hypothetical protein